MTADLGSVQQARERADEARSAFEQAMVDAHQNGAKLREIAEVAGLSHQRVWQILRGQ